MAGLLYEEEQNEVVDGSPDGNHKKKPSSTFPILFIHSPEKLIYKQLAELVPHSLICHVFQLVSGGRVVVIKKVQ